MGLNLSEETILNEWATLVERGAGSADLVISEVQKKLSEAKIPGECKWSVEEVKSREGWFSKTRRDFLVVNNEQFKDYNIYVSARDYGVHLDVCRFLTVEPGLFKKMMALKLSGDANALSAPKNILLHQDLRAWVTVVHHAVTDAVSSLMTKLGQNPAVLDVKSKGFLEVW